MDKTGMKFDRIADIYDETRGYPDIVMNDILRAMERELPKEGRILDAGVGTGRFARPLQTRGYDVIGTDIADKMLVKARQKRTSDILKGNICYMPFKDKCFEVTMCVHVLHLIAEWRLALEEISRVTRKSLVSVTSNKGKSPAQEVRRAYERFCADLGHPILPPGLRERELQELLRPTLVKKVCEFVRSVDVKQLMDWMEKRQLSAQWSVPDEIHKKAIEALRREFRGVSQLPEVERITLVVWKAEGLARFASSPHRQQYSLPPTPKVN